MSDKNFKTPEKGECECCFTLTPHDELQSCRGYRYEDRVDGTKDVCSMDLFHCKSCLDKNGLCPRCRENVPAGVLRY